MKVEYHPETTADLNAAVAFYERQDPGLGIEMRTDVYAAIARIVDNPFLYEAERGIRRGLCSRFPYSILYRVDGEIIRILTIRHHKQHPEFGSERH